LVCRLELDVDRRSMQWCHPERSNCKQAITLQNPFVQGSMSDMTI